MTKYPTFDDQQDKLEEPTMSYNESVSHVTPIPGMSTHEKLKARAMEFNGEKTTEEVFDAIECGVKQRYKSDLLLSQEHAIDLETMRERLHRMVHEVYSMLHSGKAHRDARVKEIITI